MKKLTSHVSLDFLKYSPDKKVHFADDVITDMTLNSGIFTAPDVTMAALQALRDSLNTKTIAADGGDHTAIAERDAAEVLLDTALKTEASYVSHKALGDLVIISKSGFHATHDTAQTAVKLGKAVLESYGNKTHGSIHAEIKSLPGTKGILFIGVANLQIQNVAVVGNQITFTINGNQMVLVLSTKSKIDIGGLNTGTSMTVGAVAFNAAGLSDPSEPQFVTVP